MIVSTATNCKRSLCVGTASRPVVDRGLMKRASSAYIPRDLFLSGMAFGEVLQAPLSPPPPLVYLTHYLFESSSEWGGKEERGVERRGEGVSILPQLSCVLFPV